MDAEREEANTYVAVRGSWVVPDFLQEDGTWLRSQYGTAKKFKRPLDAFNAGASYVLTLRALNKGSHAFNLGFNQTAVLTQAGWNFSIERMESGQPSTSSHISLQALKRELEARQKLFEDFIAKWVAGEGGDRTKYEETSLYLGDRFER